MHVFRYERCMYFDMNDDCTMIEWTYSNLINIGVIIHIEIYENSRNQHHVVLIEIVDWATTLLLI